MKSVLSIPWISTLYRLILSLGAAGAAACAITYPTCWFLAPLALGVWVYLVWSARSWKTALGHGLVFGLTTACAGIWWFWDTLPLDWIGLSHGPNQTYFVFASVWPVALVLGLAIVPATLLLWLIRAHPLRALALVPLWVMTEELRMWNFSFLTYAERSLLGPHFSTVSLGYALAENHYVLQLAAFGGVAALNAAVAVGAGFTALLLARKERTAAMTFALCLVLVCLTLPLVAPRPLLKGAPMSVVLIQTDIAVGQTEAVGLSFTELVRKAHDTYPKASLIVLPEERLLEPTFTSLEAKKRFFKDTFGRDDVVVVHSEHEVFGKGMQNALIYVSAQGGQLGKYRKMFLMPGGEYMPYLMTAVFSLRPDHGLGNYMDRLPSMRIEPSGLVTVPFKGHVLGGLICSDVLSPQLYRFLVREHGATLLINSANPAWFHHSRALFDKTIQMAKVHAVENRTYYLQSSNGSPAFAVDPYGSVRAMTTGPDTQLLEVAIPGTNVHAAP